MPEPKTDTERARLELRELGFLVRGAAEVMMPRQRIASLALWRKLEAVLSSIIAAAERQS